MGIDDGECPDQSDERDQTVEAIDVARWLDDGGPPLPEDD